MIHWLSFSQTRERVRRAVSINVGGTNHMKVRTRFWIEAGLASLTTLLLLLTLVRRDWIEAMFDIDPDNYSGSFEWISLGVLFVVSVAFAALARAEWRRAQAKPA